MSLIPIGFSLLQRAIQSRAQANWANELRRQTDPSNFETVQPPLDHERWNQQCKDFTFGVPFGWRDMSRDELATLSARTGTRVWSAIAAERTDDRATHISATLTSAPATFEDLYTGIETLLAERERALRGTRRQSPSLMLLDRARAVYFEVSGMTESATGTHQPRFTVSSEVWTVQSGHLFSLSMVASEEDHEGYWPVFLTVVGTWLWRNPNAE